MLAVLAAATAGVVTMAGAGAAATTSAHALPPPTRTSPVVVEHTPQIPTPIVVGVRTGRHPGYDRLVLDLEGRVPSYSVRYVRQVIQDGSGEPVALQGRAFLQVVLDGAAAHRDDGSGTVPRELRPALPALRQVKLAGDFEGYVTFGLGLADRVGFRVFELTRPTRLVIDVAHPLPPPSSTSAVTLPPLGQEQVRLTDVRHGTHPGYDRVAFTFSGPAPGVRARYVPALVQDGSGAVVPVAGRAVLELLFEPAVEHDDTGRLTWSGARSIRPGWPALQEIRAAGDYEGVLQFGLGLNERAGFRVLRLTAPTRVVVDVAH
jgi:hypothetical protein